MRLKNDEFGYIEKIFLDIDKSQFVGNRNFQFVEEINFNFIEIGNFEVVEEISYLFPTKKKN